MPAYIYAALALKVKESAKSGTKVLVCIEALPQPYLNELYQKLWM
jgi:hypothetical protein